MCSILLVEDHPDTRHVLTILLRQWGHEVAVAEGVASALVLAKSTRYDAIVSDIGLPDGDGYEFVQEVKDTPSHRALRVALTAYTSDRDRARAKIAGYHHFFDKPVDVEQLRALLLTVL